MLILKHQFKLLLEINDTLNKPIGDRTWFLAIPFRVIIQVTKGIFNRKKKCFKYDYYDPDSIISLDLFIILSGFTIWR